MAGNPEDVVTDDILFCVSFYIQPAVLEAVTVKIPKSSLWTHAYETRLVLVIHFRAYGGLGAKVAQSV
jgi:transketolase C-terminal domain/subunit